MKKVKQLQPVVIYTKQGSNKTTKSSHKSYMIGGPIRWTTTAGRGIWPASPANAGSLIIVNNSGVIMNNIFTDVVAASAFGLLIGFCMPIFGIPAIPGLIAIYVIAFTFGFCRTLSR